MTRKIASRIIIAFFIAFAISAVLAPLAAAAVDGFITHDFCGFGTSAVRVASSMDPKANVYVECIDKSGNLYTLDTMLFYKWLVFFAPMVIVLFILFYKTRWVSGQTITR